MNNLIFVGIIVGIVLTILAVIILILINNKSKNKEIPASILDVQNIGVSTSDQEFSYGYEKEETIVMDPITNIEESEKVDTPNVKNNNVQNSAVLNVSTDEAVKEEVPAMSKTTTEPNEVETLEEIKSEENSIIESIDEVEEIK